MSTEIAIQEAELVPAKALTTEESVEFKLSAYTRKVAEMKAEMAKGVPTIAGINDKVQYAKVSEKRKEAMRGRTGLDKERLSLTADARKFQDLVNSRSKEIAAEFSAIEDAYFAEENRIDKLAAEDKAAKQKIIDDRVQYRTNALLAVNGIASVRMELLAGMGEENFQAVLKAAATIFEEEKRKAGEAAAELARLQAEEAERKRLEEEAKAEAQRAESERLAAQKKAQDEERAKMDAEKAEIEREKKALADAKQKAIDDEAARVAEEARKTREAEIAKAAAEKATREAEERAKAETERKAQAAKDAEAKAEADRLEKIRLAEVARKEEEAKAKAEVARLAAIEAAKPDAEKWRQFAAVVRGMQLPVMATPKGEDVERLVKVNIENLAKLIESEAAKLTK